MRIIRKYEDAKKMVEDAGLIGENDGHPDIHYQEIAHLLAEVKRLREGIEEALETNVYFHELHDELTHLLRGDD